MKHAWIVKYMGKGRSASVIVVTGKSNCRLTGLAFPLVMLPILFLTRTEGAEGAITHWLTYTLLWEVLGAVVIGAAIGYAAGHAQHWAQRTFQDKMERISLLTVTLALSLCVLGLVKLIGSDGVLAVFAAGLALNTVLQGQEEARQERTQEVVKRFFDLPVFVLLGMALPWQQWFSLGWSGLLLVMALLLLRRLPVVLLLYRAVGQLPRLRDALFTGWFGPVGVAALFYATLAVRETATDIVWVVGSLVICSSLLVHGLSATPLTMLYGRVAQHDQSQPSAPFGNNAGAKQGHLPVTDHH
jgi:NhaP-type Na+/H+ or K+/H+ antiporter